MVTSFADPFETLFNIQRALEARETSDWLQNQTASQGPFPPINVFQQGEDIRSTFGSAVLDPKLVCFRAYAFPKSSGMLCDLLPELSSFIRRVCSGYAPPWGVLRTRSV